MVDEDLYEALAVVRDCLSGAADALDRLIGQKSKVVLKEFDVSKIVWTQKEGNKGPYELANKVANADNPNWKALKECLGEKDGKATFEKLFYWLFEDGDAIGRKEAKWSKKT